MRAFSNIVGGKFHAAEIEPGTFHRGDRPCEYPARTTDVATPGTDDLNLSEARKEQEVTPRG